MKKMRYGRRLLAAAALITTLGVGAMTVDTAFAATENRPSSAEQLIEAIANKFDLKVADVQAVFDEQIGLREANRDQMRQDHFDQLVEDGELSADQADAIIEMQDETQKEYFRPVHQKMMRRMNWNDSEDKEIDQPVN